MVQSLPTCLYCGLPLQSAAQLVAIIDVVLGLLNSVVLSVHIKEKADNTPSAKLTFIKLDEIPFGVIVAFLVGHAIQLLMGVVLFFSASTKKRGICRVWLGVTGITALFTGFIFRIYGMLIVNEFSNELKGEEEGINSRGRENKSKPNPHATNTPNYNIDLHQNVAYPQPYPGNGYAYGGYNNSTIGTTLQEVHVPAALQPPPAQFTGGHHPAGNEDWKRWG